MAVGAGLEDVGVEGDAVDDAATRRGLGMTVPHSLKGRLLANAMLAFSSRSVRIWNSSSLPRASLDVAEFVAYPGWWTLEMVA